MRSLCECFRTMDTGLSSACAASGKGSALSVDAHLRRAARWGGLMVPYCLCEIQTNCRRTALRFRSGLLEEVKGTFLDNRLGTRDLHFETQQSCLSHLWRSAP